MREIPLTQSKVTLVDDADYEWLSQWKWHAISRLYTCYAACKHTKKSMHRQILGVSNPKIQVDHRDGNGLNNQRGNLRIATGQGNQGNRRKHSHDQSSQYKGVCWHRQRRKWVAYIMVNYHAVHLGCFAEERDAALAYDRAAIKYFKEFALLNI
jgi:hypothetical protein